MPNGRAGITIPPTTPSELISCLSGNDAIKLLEIIHRSFTCRTEEDFIDLFLKLQEVFHFEFAAAMLGFHDSAKGPVIVHGINISFPEAWRNEYFSKNYHQTSVLSKQNFSAYSPQYMTNTWKEHRQQDEIISLCLDFGIREGYAHGSAPLARGQNGSMFCFSGSSMECNRRNETILELIVPHLHLAFSHVFCNSKTGIGRQVLSTREKEVLNWLKQGKSSWDISVILEISERTVNYHIYNIMGKLDVSKRTQAVAVATSLGLIEIG